MTIPSRDDIQTLNPAEPESLDRGKDMIGIKEPDGLDWADKFYWAAGSYLVSIGLTSLVLEVFGLCYLGTFQAMTVIMGGIGFMVITTIGRINPTFPIWLLEWRHSSPEWPFRATILSRTTDSVCATSTAEQDSESPTIPAALP